MSLDVHLTKMYPTIVFSYHITHNLSEMASEAHIYEYLWHPEKLEITEARQLVGPLMAGLRILKSDPAYFKKFNPENGWGSYNDLIIFVTAYLQACESYPDADISVSR